MGEPSDTHRQCTGTRFRPRLARTDYDAIIIGSGIGGLTTAGSNGPLTGREWHG